MGKDRNFVEKPNIIAEIANSHGGNYEKALEIIESIPFEFVDASFFSALVGRKNTARYRRQ